MSSRSSLRRSGCINNFLVTKLGSVITSSITLTLSSVVVVGVTFAAFLCDPGTNAPKND